MDSVNESDLGLFALSSHPQHHHHPNLPISPHHSEGPASHTFSYLVTPSHSAASHMSASLSCGPSPATQEGETVQFSQIIMKHLWGIAGPGQRRGNDQLAGLTRSMRVSTGNSKLLGRLHGKDTDNVIFLWKSVVMIANLVK